MHNVLNWHCRVFKRNNGKIVYRVQTEALDGKQAEKVRQNLKNHGIDTFTR